MEIEVVLSKIEKLSKVEKSSNTWKVANVMDSEILSFLTSDTRLAVAKMSPKSSFDTIFESIINKTKQVDLLMLCRVLARRSQEDFQVKNTWVF